MRFIGVVLVISALGMIGPASGRSIQKAHLVEAWSMAGESDDHLVGEIVQAVCDSVGNTYLLDYRLQIVHVVDPDGNLVRTLGGLGDGPGETRAASQLFLDDDGRVGLLDMLASKVTWLTADGVPDSSEYLRLNDDGTGMVATYDARLWSGGYVVAFATRRLAEEGVGFQVTLAQMSTEGVTERILTHVPDPSMSQRGPVLDERMYYNFVWNCWDMDSTGRVYCATERDDPVISVFSCQGEPSTRLSSQSDRKARSASEKDAVRQRHQHKNNGSKAFLVADADPYYSHIWCDEQDRLWVMSHAGRFPQTPGVFLEYDVYAPDGESLYRVDLLGPADSHVDECLMLTSSRLIVVENAKSSDVDPQDIDLQRDTDEMRIVCYDLVVESP